MKGVLAVSILLLSSMASAETCKLPDLRLVLDGHRNSVFRRLPLGRLYRRSRHHSGTSFLPPRPSPLEVQNRPMTVRSKNPLDEGKIQSGRGRQIASMLMDGGVGIGTKDITDGLSGAIYKSWYAIPISFVTLAFFSNGGDVNLKPGYKLEVVSSAPPTGAPSLPVASLASR